MQRQREIFFETRVGGQEEVWGAVRLVCECLSYDIGIYKAATLSYWTANSKTFGQPYNLNV